MNNDKKIRALFITQTAKIGGANYSMLRLILELKSNYNVTPIVIIPTFEKSQQRIVDWCITNEIECHNYLFFWYKGQNFFRPLLKYISNIIWYSYIVFSLRKLKIDIVHSNSSVIDLGVFISRIKKVPHVWHLREYGYLDFGLKPMLGTSYERFLYKHGGDLFIAISESVKKHYSSIIGCNKITLVYNGINVPSASNVSLHMNEVIKFCVVGVINSSKNQFEVLKALKILVIDWGIKNISVTFIGRHNSLYFQELESFINEYNLQDYVVFTGEQTNVSSLLSNMDVGLMVSKNEAFGRVTVEYMMHNLAVIASSTGANPEIVTHNVNGYVYELGNSESLAACMRSLIMSKKTLVKFAEIGRETALKRFTSERNTLSVYNIYKDLIN